MKRGREIVEILEAYDLTGSYRAAAELAGCDHHTVARYVKLRAEGRSPEERTQRARPIDEFMDKIEELVARSGGRVRADVVHRRITTMGFAGGERTTRRAVAAVKKSWQVGQRRVFRPWIPEPGLWLQFDWGEGPRIGGRRTGLWCAWLPWSRFRVVIPVLDKTLPTVVACLDATLRRLGGVPAYVLTDNEKTITVEHVADIAVRNPEIVQVARHYGMTIRTCVPADPQSKGGAENTVKIAKADLVPTNANLLGQYRTFAELEAACRDFTDEVNARLHRDTRRRPAEALLEERARLHPLPARAFTVAFGTTRRVNWDCTISVDGVRYSVPHHLVDTRVWARFHGDELIVTAVSEDGPAEVARHQRAQPGRPSIRDEHYPPRSRQSDTAQRVPRARTADEAAFLALGPGAAAWLVEAAAAGIRGVRRKMAEAVALAKLHGVDHVDRALGTAALAGRFSDNDLIRILAHQRDDDTPPTRASETHSLQPGTSAWSTFGTTGEQ
ncbi:IS21 family transposase [Micromonospora maris]|uniref:IS21 family transposase n=1 Tax=Micromonospora maris TaxID=1003110 RepID=UPI002E10CFDD|nr:IS21 family transposase [Micromonospora maris]WSK40635.1 IS21 family transposase [Micromonospora maris]WSK40787.1 IS21 family transposase [Micromonospora maris]WSK41572.1 IS21 family transposase [Micromonospora maris]WSK43541.1 IS21 family transposase [Micromonospora maris]WSK45245.1 IS21 family transposase [Micromonospora maris]